MRYLFLIFPLLVFSVTTLAKSGAWSPGYYEVVGDRYDASIKDGFFLIRGVVANTTNGEAIPFTTITNAGGTHSCQTDADGLFNLKIPVTDTLVYCYAAGYGEVLLKGPFKNKHCITVKVFLEESVEVVYKPVIYAYHAAGNVHLSLKSQGTLTFTYPETTAGEWNIQTNANGMLTNLENGKNYPYLFWEGEQAGLKIIQNQGHAEGFLIKTDTCISFLENTLSAYGLNERETTDFITFWGPKVAEKPYALIQFLTTVAYEKTIAELTIDPKPESLLRLYMYLVPLENANVSVALTKPRIEPFVRSGFTVVEWGGSVLDQFNLKSY